MAKANRGGSVIFCRYKKWAFKLPFGQVAWCKNYRQAWLRMGKVTPILNVTVLHRHG